MDGRLTRNERLPLPCCRLWALVLAAILVPALTLALVPCTSDHDDWWAVPSTLLCVFSRSLLASFWGCRKGTVDAFAQRKCCPPPLPHPPRWMLSAGAQPRPSYPLAAALPPTPHPPAGPPWAPPPPPPAPTGRHKESIALPKLTCENPDNNVCSSCGLWNSYKDKTNLVGSPPILYYTGDSSSDHRLVSNSLWCSCGVCSQSTSI